MPDDVETPDLPGPAKIRTVRPRYTWVALVLLLVGLVLVATGIMAMSWAWAIAGIAALVAGAALAAWAGLFYDVQGSSSAADQVDAIKRDETRGFPAAGTTWTEDEVKDHVHRQWDEQERQERNGQE